MSHVSRVVVFMDPNFRTRLEIESHRRKCSLSECCLRLTALGLGLEETEGIPCRLTPGRRKPQIEREVTK